MENLFFLFVNTYLVMFARHFKAGEEMEIIGSGGEERSSTGSEAEICYMAHPNVKRVGIEHCIVSYSNSLH